MKTALSSLLNCSLVSHRIIFAYLMYSYKIDVLAWKIYAQTHSGIVQPRSVHLLHIVTFPAFPTSSEGEIRVERRIHFWKWEIFGWLVWHCVWGFSWNQPRIPRFEIFSVVPLLTLSPIASCSHFDFNNPPYRVSRPPLASLLGISDEWLR